MRRIHQLDAVRGIAVLLVLVHNTDNYPTLHLGWIATYGWMGVDLFFVLSGFLITGILLDSRSSDGYFRDFYARRCLRIWPLYYAALVFMFVVVPFLHPAERANIFGVRSGPWWSYLIFLQNFLVPVPTNALGLLGVTWSLAVEEQFYLIWPLIVRFCSVEQIRRIAFIVICVSPWIRLYLSRHAVIIYSNSFCRLDGLMAGALLATAVRSKRFDQARFLGLAWITLGISTGLTLLLEALQQRWLVFSFVALAAVSLIYLALFSQATYLQRILANRFLVYTGTISYGIYLLAKIPVDVVKVLRLDQYPLLAFTITVCGAYVLAIITWNFLERPFLRLKHHFESRPVQRAYSAR